MPPFPRYICRLPEIIAVVLAVSLPCLRVVAGSPGPIELRCEYATEPLGIDERAPRLSWGLGATNGGAAQEAYQVLVSSSREFLARDQGDLWDSGKVISSQSANVVYGGKPLVSRQRCWWKVRIWNEYGSAGAFSEVASFEMGLLERDDWQAEWAGGAPAWPGRALYYRSSFSLAAPPRHARLYVSGLGFYETFVNGIKQGEAVLAPNISDAAKRVYYRSFDVAPSLRVGGNVLGAVVGSGWQGTHMLRAQLEIECTDGTRVLVATGRRRDLPSWVVGPGPILGESIFDGETYDARLEKAGWDRPGYNPYDLTKLPDLIERWDGPYLGRGPGGVMQAEPLEAIQVVRELPAVGLSEPKPGIFVFDFGQNHAGWARLRVRGPRGTTITLRYAELVAADGTVNQTNITRAVPVDYYVLSGNGEEVWAPRFTYHGYRYVQVEGWPGKPARTDLTACAVRSAVARRGEFSCSNELLNRIHRLVLATEESNLHGVPTDCPNRGERLGWLNDLAARSEELVYNFEAIRLLEKFVTDINDAQDRRTGAIGDTAPLSGGGMPGDPVSVAYLLIPSLLHAHYGDVRVIERNFDGMRRWVDYLTSRATDGIVNLSYWGDWAPPAAVAVPGSIGSGAISAGTPGPLVSTAFHYYAARLLSGLAAGVQRPAEASRYAALAEEIQTAFNRTFWNEEAGGYGSNNQACNALALYVGLVPTLRKARTVASLIRAVEAANFHLTTGNIATKHVLEVLSGEGYVDIAARIATQKTYPSWGFMLERGATTLWERWELLTGSGMNSHNHPMLGSVGSWLYRWVAGLRVESPRGSSAHFVFQPPVLAQVTQAQASLPTPWGVARISWTREGSRLRGTAVVPWNCTATLRLPEAEPRQLDAGTHQYEATAPLPAEPNP